MKHLLFLTVLLAFGQPYTAAASDFSRTGQQIHKQAVAYFGLFPSIDSIQTVLLPDDTAGDSLLVRIKRTRPLQDITIPLHKETLDALAQYIEHFEQVYTHTFIPNWQLLQQIVRPRAPCKQQQPIDIHTVQDKHLMGLLLATTDSALVLYKGNSWTNWKTYTDSLLVVVPFYDIEAVDGRFIGKNKHLFGLALRFLQERTVFHYLPPELHRALQTLAVEQNTPALSLEKPDALLQQHFPPTKFHLTVMIGASRLNAEPDLYYLATGREPFGRYLGAPVNIESNATYMLPTIDFYFSLLKRFSIGITYSSLPTIGVEYNAYIRKHTRMLDGYALAFYSAYSLLQPDVFLDSPIEIQAVAGLAFTDVNIHTFAQKKGAPTIPVESIDNYQLFSPYLAAKLDYFFARTFSAQCKLELVPTASISDTITGSTKQASVGLERFTIAFGIGVHL